ncbi:MAG TPA: hypothetical protein VLA49_07810 [Anaerolineales bacterium]|nr:hypothetical protein [Anaerolineales bacterium]
MLSRWIRFALAILLGIIAGLVYGWYVNPVKYVDTTPDSLGVDYKTDYVLMVAEAYTAEADLDMAVRRLALLGEPSPQESVNQAILFAERQGYTDADVATIRQLLGDLQLYRPAGGVTAP